MAFLPGVPRGFAVINPFYWADFKALHTVDLLTSRSFAMSACDRPRFANSTTWSKVGPLAGFVVHVCRPFMVVSMASKDWVSLPDKCRALVKLTINAPLRPLDSFTNGITEALRYRPPTVRSVESGSYELATLIN